MNDHFNENTSENFNSSFTKQDSFSSSNRRETKREIPNKRRLSLIRNQEDLSRFYSYTKIKIRIHILQFYKYL